MQQRTSSVVDRLLKAYDKRLRPNIGGSPCHIRVSLHILSMVPIKEIDMEITSVFFFRQHWRDVRLAYGSAIGLPKLKLLGDILSQVWLPDTFFINDMSDNPTRSDFLFELTQDGDITYSARKKIRFYCPMNLQRFPMDEPSCELKFESYSYNNEDVTYSWSEHQGLTISGDLQIPQYRLLNWTKHSYIHYYSTGNFSALGVKFYYKREIGFYILQNFIPTILIVAVSWVGFWIDERSVPARVSLGITTVLAITTLMFGVQTSLPRVGHVKAIDVLLLGSFLFVFAALVEYAVICTFTIVLPSTKVEPLENGRLKSKKSSFTQTEEWTVNDLNWRRRRHIPSQQDREQEFRADVEENQPLPDVNLASSVDSRQHGIFKAPCMSSPCQQRAPCVIDRRCRVLFPLAYALYLIIYFALYIFVIG